MAMAEEGPDNLGNIKRKSSFKDGEKCLASLLIESPTVPVSLRRACSQRCLSSTVFLQERRYSLLCEVGRRVGFGSHPYCSHA